MNPMSADVESFRTGVRVERRRCAEIAASEYEYWKMQPNFQDPTLEAIRVSAMAAAANICAAIFLDRLIRPTPVPSEPSGVERRSTGLSEKGF